MAKFAGAVGYASTTESVPGVNVEEITERSYYGDVIRDSRLQEPNPLKLNDDIRVSNSISLVADAYAVDNILNMRYIWWNGLPWVITNVEVRRPRLILQIGGLWSGNTP